MQLQHFPPPPQLVTLSTKLEPLKTKHSIVSLIFKKSKKKATTETTKQTKQTFKRLTNPKPATTKIKQPPIPCQQCGSSSSSKKIKKIKTIKNKTGLYAYLRLNKKCNSTLVSAEIISSQNITLRR